MRDHPVSHRTTRPHIAHICMTYDIQYDYDIRHQLGVKMAYFDALPRSPIDNDEEEQLDKVLGIIYIYV